MYLPSAVRYGVSWETFWKLNPKKLKIWEKNFEEQQELAQHRMNLAGFVNGLYVQNAIASVLSKNAKYPTKPHELFGSQKKKTAQEEGFEFERYVLQYNAEHRNKPVQR